MEYCCHPSKTYLVNILRWMPPKYKNLVINTWFSIKLFLLRRSVLSLHMRVFQTDGSTLDYSCVTDIPHYREDGSFIRIEDIWFVYCFPARVICKIN